jgi:uncharacterized protein (TIGR01244 family)
MNTDMPNQVQLDPDVEPIPAWREAAEGLYSSGQPQPGQWNRLAAAGLRSVLNLRPACELPGRDEAKEVAEAGLGYAQLPIADAASLDREAARGLDTMLRQLAAPLLVHCASGNRVGALVALREAWFVGADAEVALARGRAAGLAGLEPQVRRQLGLPEPDA